MTYFILMGGICHAPIHLPIHATGRHHLTKQRWSEYNRQVLYRHRVLRCVLMDSKERSKSYGSN
jgi:hypothetical protein